MTIYSIFAYTNKHNTYKLWSVLSCLQAAGQGNLLTQLNALDSGLFMYTARLGTSLAQVFPERDGGMETSCSYRRINNIAKVHNWIQVVNTE